MTHDTTQSWYIDAWCPVDGLAFASRRRGSLLHEDHITQSLEAAEIIYLCPPFFEPEQIGSLATALGATRGHFQTGFYMRQREVAFPTLAAVIEAVKRVYRGGGFRNLPGTAMPLPIAPLDHPPDAVTPESLVNQDVKEAWSDLQGHLTGPKRTDFTVLRQATTKFLHHATDQGVLAKLALLSVAPVLNRFAQGTTTTTADFEILSCWISILARMGFRVELDSYFYRSQLGFRVRHKDVAFQDDLPILPEWRMDELELARNPKVSRLFHIDAQQVMDTMYRIPIPVKWPSPYLQYKNSRYAFVPTFGALFCLATASHKFLQELSSPLHFAPVMLAAMAVSISWANHTKYSNNFEEVEVTSCEWLAQSLPSFSLEKDIDDAIHNFCVTELKRRAEELAKVV